MSEIYNFLEFYVFVNENKLEKMNFSLGKMEFWTHCNVIFNDTHLRFKELNISFIMLILKCDQGNSAHMTEFLALGKTLLARLYLLYLTKNIKSYME